MLRKTMTYTDYNGEERTEDFYFNLTKAEVLEMAMSENGGLDAFIERIVAERDQKKIISLFKEIIVKSYGQKSLDGKRFIKTPEVVEEFTQTEAYSDLFTELALDAEKGAAFFNAIIPANMQELVQKAQKALEEKRKKEAAAAGPAVLPPAN